jgi:hypothetical protein
VDYQAMTGGELQEECARRGLPSSRAAKAVMVQRLLDHDAEQPQPAEGEHAMAGDAASEAADEAAYEPPIAAPIRLFRKTFTAEPDGPDEETHIANRQATLAAAAEAGLQTRGDARLAATADGRWVYEVSVRQETLS